MRILAFIIATACFAAPGAARADTLVGYGQFGTGLGGLYGGLGDELDAAVMRSHVGGGVRIDDVSIAAGFVMGFLESSNTARDGRDLLSLEYGPDVAYYLPWPNRRLQLYVGGAFHRLWWSGSTRVQRTCEQTGDCTAGFYSENPSYHGYTGKLTTGMIVTLPMKRRGHSSGMYMAFTLDVGVEHMWVDIINDTHRGNLYSATLGIRIGAGRYGDQ